MGVTESQWHRPGDEATEPAGVIERANTRSDAGAEVHGGPGESQDAEAGHDGAERRGAIDDPQRRQVVPQWVQPYRSAQEPAHSPAPVRYPPPPVGPPPRLSEGAQPAATAGAWQGALRPPVFVVNQPARERQRPTYREPLPVQGGRVAGGAALAAAWMLLLGVQASTARVYVWLTIIAGVFACATAIVLARFGDRGAAVGVALASGVGVAIAGLVVAIRLAGGYWLLW